MKSERRLAEVSNRIADVKAEIELIRFTLIIYTYVNLYNGLSLCQLRLCELS